MPLNISFNHLPRANAEILKAFNSQNAAKALEAYQPLNAKERARQKLKALQVLKQESSSQSIGDISLTPETLANALKNSEGATLQAMLNLLSSKMIEQNKNTILDFLDKNEEQLKVKKDSQEKKKQNKQQTKKKKESPKEKEGLVEETLKRIEKYFKTATEQLIKMYEDVLDAVSIRRLRSLFEESLNSVKKYAYEVPVETLDQYIVTPIYEFPNTLKDYIGENLDKLTKKNEKKTFTAKEIREILNASIDDVRSEFNEILDQSVNKIEEKVSKNSKPNKVEEKDANWKPRVIVNKNREELRTILHQHLQ